MLFPLTVAGCSWCCWDCVGRWGVCRGSICLVVTTFGDMCVLLFPSFCYCIDFIESLLVGWTDCVVFSERFIFIVLSVDFLQAQFGVYVFGRSSVFKVFCCTGCIYLRRYWSFC